MLKVFMLTQCFDFDLVSASEDSMSMIVGLVAKQDKRTDSKVKVIELHCIT